MPTLYLVTPGLRASLHSERIRVEYPPEVDGPKPSRDVPLHDVDLVVANERVALSFAAVAEIVRRDIPLVILGWNHDVVGLAHPPAPNNLARRAQYERSRDAAWSLAFAATIVEAKISNSRRVLQRLAANREDANVDRELAALDVYRQRSLQATNMDELRGYEGTSAGTYFAAYGSFFPENAPFERRSRRPPHNAANAILSFAYTLLTAETEAQVHACGLDPAVGFLHEPDDGRPSIALDLVETMRAPVGDALALDTLSHQILRPGDHFEERNGGIYLNREGRGRFFNAYERRMEREFTSEQLGTRTTLRREINRQVQSAKAAILNNEVFVPFVMN